EERSLPSDQSIDATDNGQRPTENGERPTDNDQREAVLAYRSLRRACHDRYRPQENPTERRRERARREDGRLWRLGAAGPVQRDPRGARGRAHAVRPVR